MRLLWLRVADFRQSRELQLEFGRSKGADPALAFMVGPNGAGKSRVLEMLGRIFSHLSAGIPVGLDFDVEYELGDRRVLVTTRPPVLGEAAPPPPPRLERIDAWMLVAEGGFEGWSWDHFVDRWPGESELGEILPYRVVGLSVGPASRLDLALRGSVLDSLGQRLDLGDSRSPPPNMPSEEWDAYVESEKALLAEEMRRTANEPRCVALSGNELLLAILALLTHPIATRDGDEARDAILGRIGIDARRSLCAFSLDIAADWQQRIPRLQRESFEGLLAQAARRVARDTVSTKEEWDSPEREQRAVFEVKPSLQAWIGGTSEAPLVWFSQLLGWLKLGVLRSIRLILSKEDGSGLLRDDDFSDGEFLLAGRYALLLLLREHGDCLVLFDEPETHFNDAWKVDLISDLVRVLEGNSAQVVIATHSDLTLTDADRSDVYVLNDRPSDGEEVPAEPSVSTFAADRGEIAAHVFGAGQGSGSHALGIVNRALASRDPNRLRETLDRVGPGFHSFRLRYALTEDAEDAS